MTRGRRQSRVRRRTRLIATLAGVLVALAGVIGLVLNLHAGRAAYTPGPVPRVPAPTGRLADLASAAGGQVPRPVSLVIPAIGVRTRLIRLGTTADGGVQVPSTTSVAGWYTASARPGAIGPAVILGHVDSYSGPGVFIRLKNLHRGDKIFVRRRDGSVAEFVVTNIAHYLKSRFPARAVYGPVMYSAIRLITCGGVFDYQTGHYLSNVVVYGHQVARHKQGWSPARAVGAVAGALPATSSESCVSPGNCTLEFPALTSRPHLEGEFTVSEVHGRWRKPRPVPVPNARLSVSCTAPGYCVAAGTSIGTTQAVVAREVHGSWSRPQPVPGLAALSKGGYTQVSAFSCGARGWCAAAGYYWLPGHPAWVGHKSQPFVVSEHGGTWQSARRLPGHAALNGGRAVWITAMACDQDGDCTAAGSYRIHPGNRLQPFAVTEREGTWGNATAIAGVTGPYQNAGIARISCATQGNCTAVGTYATDPGQYPDMVFAVQEDDGTWGRARALRVPANVRGKLGEVALTGLSCAAPGQCALAGYVTSAGSYKYSLLPAVPFLAAEAGGTWGPARVVPGLARLRPGKQAELTTLSCAAPGDCAAGGFYSVPHSSRAFVLAQADGSWSRAARVPGLSALGPGRSETDVVWCLPGRTRCVAAGDYRTRTGQIKTHLFVTAKR